MHFEETNKLSKNWLDAFYNFDWINSWLDAFYRTQFIILINHL